MIRWEAIWTLIPAQRCEVAPMLENAHETMDLATEDIKERKQVQSQRDFEPLLDTEEAARLLRMHPRTLRTKARRGSIPAFHVGSLARQTCQLMIGSEEQKTSRPNRIADLF